MEKKETGKIIKAVGGLYTVKVGSDSFAESGGTVRARARGVFRHDKITPLAGDFVELVYEENLAKNDNSDGGGFMISKILPRRNALIRPPLANIDIIFATLSCRSPAPSLLTLDKLISVCEHNKIEPVVIVTKTDLDPRAAENICEIYRRSGFSCFGVSSLGKMGIGEIRDFIRTSLPGRTAAFAGASGVGKSTLMNLLFPDLNLSTAELSRKTDRGCHTTRHVELFPASDLPDGGYIADTPGFSLLDFERFDFFDAEDLPLTMREFSDYIGQCKFTKCSHTKESGCAVLAAVRDGKIEKSRHDSYLAMYADLKDKRPWQKPKTEEK